MNSLMELLNLLCSGDSGEAPSAEKAATSSFSRSSGANQLDATRRVYSHPMFKQNLVEDVRFAEGKKAGHDSTRQAHD